MYAVNLTDAAVHLTSDHPDLKHFNAAAYQAKQVINTHITHIIGCQTVVYKKLSYRRETACQLFVYVECGLWSYILHRF